MANYTSSHTGSVIDNIVSNALTKTEAASIYVGLTNDQTISGIKTFSTQPLLNSGFKWPAPANVSCTASANSQEWSIDCGTSGYTGCYFHIWSATQNASILQCFVDNRHVAIPVHLYVGDYNNTSFGISTNSLISNGNIQCNASINVPSGAIWAGTNGNTAAERQIGVQSGAGRLYMYSSAATTGARGLYGSNHAGNAAGYLSINQSNAATHSTTSDKRIKNDKGMLSVEETKNILTELKIVNFNYKLDEENEIKQNVEHCGVYAQDVRDLLLKYNYKNRNLLSMTIKNNQLQDEGQLYEGGEEELIPITPDISSDITIPEEEVDLYQMNYIALVSYLVKGWQIHEQEIQQLKEQIKVLTNK